MKNLVSFLGVPLIAASLVSGCNDKAFIEEYQEKIKNQQVQLDEHQKKIEELYCLVKEAERAAVYGVAYEDLKGAIWAERHEENHDLIRYVDFQDTRIIAHAMGLGSGRENKVIWEIKFPVKLFGEYRLFEIQKGDGSSRGSKEFLGVISSSNSITTLLSHSPGSLKDGKKITYEKNPSFIY